MSTLRNQMLQVMQQKNFSENTIRTYLGINEFIQDFRNLIKTKSFGEILAFIDRACLVKNHKKMIKSD